MTFQEFINYNIINVGSYQLSAYSIVAVAAIIVVTVFVSKGIKKILFIKFNF